MILPVHTTLQTRIVSVLTQHYGLDPATLPSIVIEYPPNRAMGDFAVPVAFELARTLRKPPRVIAQELVAALGTIDGLARITAAPNGYVNFSLDRPAFVIRSLSTPGASGWGRRARDHGPGVGMPPDDIGLDAGGRPRPQPPTPDPERKTIVEHTAINPNKAAHIGHLRNAILGDTLVRLLRFRGVPVEIQNYIDDTGVQLADVIVGFRELESKGPDAIRQLADAPRFDYYCWDLYARVTTWYEADATRLKLRAAALRDLEHGDNDTAQLAHFIADRIVRRHLETMARMNIGYDLLTWEGDILRLRFWEQAFDVLKRAGAVFLQTTGKLAGCWVMPIDEGRPEPTGGESAGPRDTSAATSGVESAPEEESAESRAKVIVRSDGTVTYVGKDIAYQFWKFGLLGKDFYYRVFSRQENERPLWATGAQPVAASDAPRPPSFGGAKTVYNVIDTRQAYLQKLLQQALVAIQCKTEAERSIHFSYEIVVLSQATARALGYSSSPDADRAFVTVSGRKGLGVKADALLDRLMDAAAAEVAKRNPDLSAGERTRIAEMIGTAAVRYFMIKYSRGKVITFDIDEALSFEGESGPYLQYAVVRANNIFHKLRDRDGLEEADLIGALGSTPTSSLESEEEGNDLWGVILEAARLDEIADQAVRTLELSMFAKYAFGLAQSFNALYHRYPVLNEEREHVRKWRAAAVSYFRLQMTRALHLMGCEVPSRM